MEKNTKLRLECIDWLNCMNFKLTESMQYCNNWSLEPKQMEIKDPLEVNHWEHWENQYWRDITYRLCSLCLSFIRLNRKSISIVFFMINSCLFCHKRYALILWYINIILDTYNNRSKQFSYPLLEFQALLRLTLSFSQNILCKYGSKEYWEQSERQNEPKFCYYLCFIKRWNFAHIIHITTVCLKFNRNPVLCQHLINISLDLS